MNETSRPETVPWRLLETPPLDPFRNMALDEAIASSVRRGESPPTVRFYSWAAPSISIGYFQRVEEAVDVKRCLESSIPVVRRLTGGKAVLHDKEMTYSVCAGRGHKGFRTVQETYLSISTAIVRAVQALGIPAEILATQPEIVAPSPYCFASPSRYEIVVAGKKLIGSAQRRWREAFLQHGSIPFSVDPYYLSFLRGADHSEGATTMEEILNRPIDPDTLRKSIINGFEAILDVRQAPGKLTQLESAAADLLMENYRNQVGI